MLQFEALQASGASILDINDAVFAESRETVNKLLSDIGTQHFLDAANNVESDGGMQYLVVGGGDDCSKESAIVVPAPFGNGVWPQGIAAGVAISYLAAEAGLRDSQGDIIPVMLTAAPSMKSDFSLSERELSWVRNGNFAPIALKQLKLLKTLGFTSVGGFVGYSGAAPQAEPFMTLAINDNKLKRVGNTVIGAAPHSVDYGAVRGFLAFVVRSGLTFKKQYQAEGIYVINDIFASGQASPDFVSGIAKKYQENWAIFTGLKNANLSYDLNSLAEQQIKTLLLNGAKDAVAPSKAIRRAYSTAASDPAASKMRHIEITGTDHNLADRVASYAAVAAAHLAL